jgi:hypothetical protein
MIRLYLALGAAGIVLIVVALFAYHERSIEHTKDVALDAKATAKIEKVADTETEANIVKAAVAALGAKNAQTAVDTYLSQHPVDLSVREPATPGGGCMPQARTAAGGAASAGAGPAAGREVPGGGENLALAEVVSSFARLAVLDNERQQQ